MKRRFKEKNRECQYMDECGLVLGQNRPWNPNGDHGMGDCIGTTHDAYRAYGYKRFIYGIENCFDDVDSRTIVAYRHPSMFDIKPNTMSRDHVAYALCAFKVGGNEWFINQMATKMRWRISDKYTFTPDLWLYMHALNGSTLAEGLYYGIAIPYMTANMIWKNLVWGLLKVQKEVPQSKWDSLYMQMDRPNWQRKLIGSVFPMYSLFQLSFMLDVMRDSWAKKLLQRILRTGVDKQNFVVRMLLGDKKVTKEEVYDYKPMWGGRWTTYLSEVNNRDLRVINDPKILSGNCVDRDLVRTIYDEKIEGQYIRRRDNKFPNKTGKGGRRKR